MTDISEPAVNAVVDSGVNPAVDPVGPVADTVVDPGVNTGVNIQAQLARFGDLWAPHRIAGLNDYDVKIVKLRGEFVWHTHDETDELFLVISGRLTIQLRDGDVVLLPGELYVVPKGVEHCPRAEEETAVLLLEPAGTVNTGSAGGPMTVAPVRLD